MLNLPDAVYFIQRVDVKESGCWNWTGVKDNFYGYGLIGRRGLTPRRAHRFAYRLFIGSIPEHHDIHHECQNRICVNPAHLKALHHTDHPKHGGNAVKTHCPKDHPYNGENLWIAPGRGGRNCRTCMKASNREFHLREKQEKKADA